MAVNYVLINLGKVQQGNPFSQASDRVQSSKSDSQCRSIDKPTIPGHGKLQMQMSYENARDGMRHA